MTRHGFSLVELSIVLVILGLLTGGILAGQSLIRAAELRSVFTEINKYRSAAYSFRDKYFALPGDMANATSFWTSLGGTGADSVCQNMTATSQATCNGNGDGQILTSVVSGDEIYRAWQHMANAGLIEGSFTGVGPTTIPGTNQPRSKANNSSYWTLSTSGASIGNASRYTADYQHNLQLITLGQSQTVPGSFALPPEEVWNIDTKLDDGLPGSGTVISNKGNATNTNCTTAAGVAPPADVNSTYVLSNRNKDCYPSFLRIL